MSFACCASRQDHRLSKQHRRGVREFWDVFRGRASAGRQLIESARRSLTELGMRHALLEVDQFAGNRRVGR